eukprot:gene17674-20131_t
MKMPRSIRYSTGKQGFSRNLTVGEIIGQLWMAEFELRRTKGIEPGPKGERQITNVVMMGMGEPLLNFEPTATALKLMLDDNAYGLSRRRVTLSTSGVVPMMDKLSQVVPVALAAEPDHAASDSAGRVIDRRLASVNYNIGGATVAADSTWARARLTWKLAPGWTLRDELSFYTADRHWRNAESYSFRAPRQVARDLVDITHDHDVAGNRLDLIHNGSLAGMKHRFAAGAEYTRTRFSTGRTFSNGSGAADAALVVDALAPVYGEYIGPGDNPALYAGAGNRTRFATR